MFSFKANLKVISSSLGYTGVAVPQEVCLKLKELKTKRVTCTVNKSKPYQCALLSNGKGGFNVLVNKGKQKELHLSLGKTIEVMIAPDNSKYGLPMPEELEALFKIDSESDRIFHQLTPGKQRSLLHIIGKFKSSDKRIEKSLIMVEYLKSVHGKLDFKELHQAFKDAKDPLG